jgi:hypothetical protein
MTAILDSCALILSVVDTDCRRQARLTFAMARHAVADLARVLNRKPRVPDPDRLPDDALARLRAQLSAARIPLRTDADADRKLAELRAMYEPMVAELSALLLMPLPPWMPPAEARENWVAHL